MTMKYTMKRLGRQAAGDVTYENGAQFLLSYATPVAAYIPGLGFMETEEKFSVTTSKHISQWKKRMGYPLVARVPQEEIANWLRDLDRLKFGEQA
jgi:hypothetical protein